MSKKGIKKTIARVLVFCFLIGLTIQLPSFQRNVYALTSTNLIPNPGFESDFTGWAPNDGRAGMSLQPVIDSTTAHSGLKSVKFTANVDAITNNIQSTTLIQVIPGQIVKVALYSKTNLTKDDMSVTIRYSDPVGTAYYDSQPLKQSNDWTRQELTFVVPDDRGKAQPNNYKWYANLFITMMCEAEGTAWVDDIEVYVDNLVSNPGFEDTASTAWSGNINYYKPVADPSAPYSLFGNYCAKLAAAPSGQAYEEIYTTETIPTYEGQELTFVAHHLANSYTSPPIYMKIVYYDQNGSVITTSTDYSTTSSNKSVGRIMQTVTSPAGAKSLRMYFRFECSYTSDTDPNKDKAVCIDQIWCYPSNNILNNAGFEDGSSMWRIRSTIIDSTDKNSGNNSIKLTGDPGNAWNVFEKETPVYAKQGEVYTIESFIKSNITAGVMKMGLRFVNSNLVTIGYGWYDVPSTSEWTKYKEVFTAPEGTEYVQPYFWLSQDAVGNVWVDDIVLNKVDPLTMKLSNNRLWTTESYLTVRFDVVPPIGDISDYMVRLERYNYGETTPTSAKDYTSFIDDYYGSYSYITDRISVADLPMGYSVLKARLIRISDSKVIQTKIDECQKIEKMQYQPLPDTTSVTIGANNNILLNGSPFMPRIMYHINTYDYEVFRERGINTVQARPEYLDDVHSADMKAMCALYINPRVIDYIYITETINRYKDHPALFCWLLNDEPDLNGVSASDMQNLYNYVKSLDPNHPVMFVRAYKFATMMTEYDSALDIMMSDPYPIGEYSEKESFRVIQDRVDYMETVNKPTHMVLQTFGGYLGWDVPNDEQLRVMAYVALNHGTDFFSYYSCDDSHVGYLMRRNGDEMWSAFKGLNQELELLKEVIAAPAVAQDIVCSSSDIDIKVREYNAEKYIFAVNKTNKQINVTFSGTGLTGKTSAQPVYEYRSINVSTNTFTDVFTPYMVHVYKLQ